MAKLQFNRIHQGYVVLYTNGCNMGEILMGEDGYYAYWAVQRQGYQEAWTMRAVADKLDELNAEWDEQVRSMGEEEEMKDG